MMKAIELTDSGFYWYCGADREWTVVLFSGYDDVDQWPFYFAGNDQPFGADDFPGDFVGPLEPPSSPELEDF